jgi:hypothetical protein
MLRQEGTIDCPAGETARYNWIKIKQQDINGKDA